MLLGAGKAHTLLPIAWWKANGGVLFQNSNGTTAASSNNDPVGYWADVVGTRHVIQGTSGKRPLLQTSGPGIKFDGSDDVLSYAGSISDVVGTLVIAFTTGSSMFTAAQVLIGTADASAANKWFEVGITSDGRIYVEYNNAGTKHTVVGSSFLDVSTTYALMLAFDGTDYYAMLGTTEQNPLIVTNVGTFGWFGSVSSASNLTLGATITSAGTVRPFNGQIHEALIYARDVT